MNLETEGKISQAVLIFLNIIILEAAIYGVLKKNVLLEISQNSQENTCARDSILIKKNFIKKEFINNY